MQKIVLENFMCHSNLEVELSTNVNFIHGRNGSEYFPCSGNGKQCCVYSWLVNSTLKLLIVVGANLVNLVSRE